MAYQLLLAVVLAYPVSSVMSNTEGTAQFFESKWLLQAAFGFLPAPTTLLPAHPLLTQSVMLQELKLSEKPAAFK